ncbi:MAG: hypothetical protein Q9162_006706 [Coniocarpon cinnabarinum]
MSSSNHASSTPTRSSSSSRRPTPNEVSDLPFRAASTSQRSPVPSRSNAAQTASNRPPSSSRQAQLATVARRDFEQADLPHGSSRRSSSVGRRDTDRQQAWGWDEAMADANNRHGQRASSRGAGSRHNSGIDSRNIPRTNGTSATEHGHQRTPSNATGAGTSNNKDIKDGRRVQVQCQTGTWSLLKTVGAGSMGKVKLAKNQDTGEQAAIKIVPRYSSEEHRNEADRIRAEHSKEVRTQREAAIVTLVNHPFICGMRDVLKTNHHWYMVFEYVNGGQMLDYIISHGRLKEKQARKFGRQIASSLDYCHRNSIVHRDLKIENILISKTGDIKIIDFGLSNLFSPRNHLKTFCGSLYFAAPELLNAKQYTGPEVDVWSFGIVLYVLVCGKVPFDDQSMPQLHAKIKKGAVEYPPWLSSECKHIISRMLVTDPKNRATLSEIMNHPWMTKGFNGAPENYLPPREPLTLPLDEKVIDKMNGFEFGPPEWIRNQLENIINSEDYQRAMRAYSKKNHGAGSDSSGKRASVFDFYQRRRSNISKDGLPNSSSTETIACGEDPVNAFHPLLSIYYLAREKQEREKQETNPGATSIPLSPGEKPLTLPDLPPPQAAYTNSHSQEMKGEAPTGGRSRPRARTQGEGDMQNNEKHHQPQRSPVKPAEPQPTSPAPPEQPPTRANTVKRESGAVGGIFRRFSTRTRGRDSEAKEKAPPSVAISSADEKSPSHPPSAAAATTSHPIPRHSFSMRKTRDRDTPPSSYKPPPSEAGRSPQLLPQEKQDLLAPPASARESPSGSEGRSSPNRLRKGLARSASVNSSDLRRKWSARRGASDGTMLKTGKGTESERSSISDQKRQDEAAGAASDRETETPMRRSFAARTRSLGHGRLVGAALSRNSTTRDRDHAQQPPRESDLPEETDAELAAEEADEAGYSSADATPRPTEPDTPRISSKVSRNYGSGYESQETLKPVYLKGLFSVSTTSSKPLHVIRADIIRVLRQLGVDYREMKGGFSCRHLPSIDLHHKRSGEMEKVPSQRSDGPIASPTGQTHRRKISFAGLRNNERQREASRPDTNDEEKPLATPDPEKQPPATPRTAFGSRGPSAYASYNNSDVDDSDPDPGEQGHRPRTLRKRTSRLSSAHGRSQQPSGTGTGGSNAGGTGGGGGGPTGGGSPAERMAGETSTHVQNDMGTKDLALRFEILVVKVPIVSLHGLQFKKVEGGTWQYKRMADRILGELRL